MKQLKNGSLSKIIIFQCPTLERILLILSATLWSAIPITYISLHLYQNKEELLKALAILIVMLIYCVFAYFCVFKTYICLNIADNKLIIRENFGFKKTELCLDKFSDIRISDGIQYKELFTIDIKYDGHTQKIVSWSAQPTCLAMFSVYKRQTKRLNEFSSKCNEYLKNRENLYSYDK